LGPGLSEGELSDKARPLFVVGCPRSGTTAFADYLNRHPEVLVCQERYNKVPWGRVTRDLFAFGRILDFEPEQTDTPPFEGWVNYHTELLARKDPAKLKWVGDKIPNYVRNMGLLAENNPGARFIVLYRPVEEVAESTDARSKDPDDPWFYGKNGVETALESWNAALRGAREFIEGSPSPRALVVGYQDFFSRNEAVTPLISRFLGIEFGESVARTWQEASSEFEGGRRHKEPLGAEQLALIRERADREAEAWVLERIERQTREPELYVEEGAQAALASLNEAEAGAWRLRQRVKALEDELADERRKARRLRKKARRLSTQKQDLQDHEAPRPSNKLERIRTRVLRKLRRPS
jgi:hypothetical protein